MIRINLLGPVRRGPAIPELSPGILLAVAAVLGLVVVLGLWSAALYRSVGTLHADLAKAQQEAAQLQTVADQVQALDKTAARLRQRQAVLDQLLGTQLPASDALEAIRSVIPHDVWLINVNTVSATKVTFDGYTFSYPSVARFMTDLQDSGRFVNIDLTSTEMDKVAEHDVVKFQVTGDLTPTQHPVVSERGATP